MSPKQRTWILVGSIAVALIAFVVWRWAKPEPISVDAFTVDRGRVEQTATNSRAGTVEARRRAQLSPDTGGRVVSLPCRKGERVHAGDVLIELDSTLERGEVALREAQVESARADSERACLAAERGVRALGRNRELAAEKLIPADALDGFESAAQEGNAACAAARAARASAGAALDVARQVLAKRTVRAPFDGIVADLSTEVGEFITPAPPGVPIPPVVDLIDPTSIYLSLPMDEVDAGKLHAGLRVRATVDSRPGESFPGKVVRVAPYVVDVQAQNRTVEIEVELDDPKIAESLLPGTSSDVEVILDARDDVLRLPTSAVLAGNRALLVEGDHLVERDFVPGLRNWDYTEIRSGLAAGQKVVTSLDRPEVKVGARVVVTADGSPRTRQP